MLRDWASKYRRELDLDPNLSLTVPSFHPIFRTIAADEAAFAWKWSWRLFSRGGPPFDSAVPEAGSFPFRAGVTLIVEAPRMTADSDGHTVARPPEVRFAIGKRMTGPDAKLREQQQRSFAIAQGLAIGDA